MPELCRFYNIVIKMLYSDNEQHHKPHFHVFYAEYEASIGIDGELLAGSLPVKQLRLVQAWAAIHEDELYQAWNNAVSSQNSKGLPCMTAGLPIGITLISGMQSAVPIFSVNWPGSQKTIRIRNGHLSL